MPEIEIRRAAGLAVQVSATEGVDAAGRKIFYMDFRSGIGDAKLEAPTGNDIEADKSARKHCPVCGRPLAVVFDDRFLAERDEYAGQSSLPDVMAGVAPISCNPGVSESSPEDRNT